MTLMIFKARLKSQCNHDNHHSDFKVWFSFKVQSNSQPWHTNLNLGLFFWNHRILNQACHLGIMGTRRPNWAWMCLGIQTQLRFHEFFENARTPTTATKSQLRFRDSGKKKIGIQVCIP